MTTPLVVRLDEAGPPFPPIHEGRYEVDAATQGLLPPPAGLVEAARAAGVRMLRMGIGCWLPAKDPDPSTLADREWFRGRSLADTQDPSMYNWATLDRNLELCRILECDLLLSIDYMPASLAREGTQPELPDYMKAAIPAAYTFPDGVRNAPPADPEVFAAACVAAVGHVAASGVRLRYVELWNEPDLPIFYAGSYDEFFAMYRAFARAVSATGHKVGAPSWSGVLDPDVWLDRFLSDIVADGVPLDFYSFHRYPRSVERLLERCVEVRRALDAAGLSRTEAVLDEWGWALDDAPFYGTVAFAAFLAACLMRLPDVGVSAQTAVLLIDPLPPEHGRTLGLTRRDGDPNPAFHALRAFEEFQQTPHRLPVDGDAFVLAGASADGRAITVLLANPADHAVTLLVSADAAAHGALDVLTEESFAAGGWAAMESITLGPEPVAVVLAAGTMARFRGQREEGA